jgi:Tfp pilus assembly protein PilO
MKLMLLFGRFNSKEMYMEEHWHLSKQVSLTHILTTLALLIAAFWYISDTDNRISLVEQEQEYVRSNFTRIEEAQRIREAAFSNQITQLREENNSNFERLDKKLDKIIERELSKR